jgi:hypothetical protein
MTEVKVGETTYYSAILPVSRISEGFLFARMNGEKAENNWENKCDQSNDAKLETGKYLYTINKYNNDANDDGSWSVMEHQWVIDVEGKDATCTENGHTEGKHCLLCPTTIESTVIEASGHKLTYVEASDATCTVAGNIAHYACSGCTVKFEDAEGKVVIENVIIEQLQHTYVIDEEAYVWCEMGYGSRKEEGRYKSQEHSIRYGRRNTSRRGSWHMHRVFDR